MSVGINEANTQSEYRSNVLWTMRQVLVAAVVTGPLRSPAS